MKFAKQIEMLTDKQAIKIIRRAAKKRAKKLRKQRRFGQQTQKN